ncbi:MAG: hydrogenase maturation protease [Deltaproteobacteria bacterium]|nr:hydrogenase maturation protease [Deltaproteobacteria bacterium]MBW1986841.1 hydrogenase maturation protease [Deltaproteobacteria bacterium]MBW2134965.1 hydrogenase maturation protease [Deltaproteobacteria bacterium]
MSLPSPNRVLIIGVGHHWRGDDAAGLLVASRLRAQGRDPAVVREMSGEAADLLNAWQEAAAVIIVDAVLTKAPPGTIYRFDAHAEPLPAEIFPACSTHAWGVAEAVALGRILQRLPPHLIIYGIAGQNFGLGPGLSPPVETAIVEVTQRILKELSLILGSKMD